MVFIINKVRCNMRVLIPLWNTIDGAISAIFGVELLASLSSHENRGANSGKGEKVETGNWKSIRYYKVAEGVSKCKLKTSHSTVDRKYDFSVHERRT